MSTQIQWTSESQYKHSGTIGVVDGQIRLIGIPASRKEDAQMAMIDFENAAERLPAYKAQVVEFLEQRGFQRVSGNPGQLPDVPHFTLQEDTVLSPGASGDLGNSGTLSPAEGSAQPDASESGKSEVESVKEPEAGVSDPAAEAALLEDKTSDGAATTGAPVGAAHGDDGA